MPNVLDAGPMRAFARKVAAKIGDAKIAARYEKLAFARLLEDPRNFRPARPLELDAGPAWARQAAARGEDVSVFAIHRGAAARLHSVARRLAQTCKLAASEDAADAPRKAVVAAARAFLDKFGRMNFEDAARRALYFSRVLAGWADDKDDERACPEQAIAARQGRVWLRVTSVSELRAIGREFRNCLARTTRAGSYGGMLHHGLAQFWVLRDAAGAGLVVAMAPAPAPACFTEVRGPRNAPVHPEHVDLVRLAVALGIRPNEPPPPANDAALALPQRRRLTWADAARARLAG